jgi:hypothetical protein
MKYKREEWAVLFILMNEWMNAIIIDAATTTINCKFENRIM